MKLLLLPLLNCVLATTPSGTKVQKCLLTGQEYFLDVQLINEMVQLNTTKQSDNPICAIKLSTGDQIAVGDFCSSIAKRVSE